MTEVPADGKWYVIYWVTDEKGVRRLYVNGQEVETRDD